MKRAGFTIYEVLIAMAISTILTVVLFNTLLGGTRIGEKALNTLAYLREASLLMEYVKTDIRNAPRGEHNLSGESPSLMRSVPGGGLSQVNYVFDRENGVVTRTTRGSGGRVIEFGRGRAAGKGHIVEFSVETLEVEGVEPFYRIKVAFSAPNQKKPEGGEPVTPPRTHQVQALVSQRTPAGRADKWNTAFEM